MPPWSDFEPFIVSGLALGGVYALSGVGLVVLYRATGVLYLAFGAVGALGALIAWSLGQKWRTRLAHLAGLHRRSRRRHPRLRPDLRSGPGQTGPAGQGGGHHRADPDPVRPDGPAVDDQRRPGPLADPAHRQRRLLRRADPGELDAGHRAGRRGGDHRGDGLVPALHQARHGDAGHGQRPRDHRHPRRPGPQGRGGGLARLRRAGGRRRRCCWPTWSRWTPPPSPSWSSRPWPRS